MLAALRVGKKIRRPVPGDGGCCNVVREHGSRGVGEEEEGEGRVRNNKVRLKLPNIVYRVSEKESLPKSKISVSRICLSARMQ